MGQTVRDSSVCTWCLSADLSEEPIYPVFTAVSVLRQL